MKRPLPNASDPLSESTPQRRLWAAYLKAGFTRASFARAVGIAYHTLDAWDTDSATPELHHFAKAAQLVGFTMDELVWGARKVPTNDILTELRELRALYAGLVRYLRDNQRRARQRVRTSAERSGERSAADGHQPTAADLARVRKKLARRR